MTGNNKHVSMTISGYTIAFLVLVATMFFGFGWYSLQSIEQAREEINANNRQLAQNEIQSSIDSLIKDISRLDMSIAEWDELFQQLYNPAYYGYWREHRLLNTDILPDYIDAAELFDPKGRVLAQFSNSRFPVTIDTSDIGPAVHTVKGQIVLIVYLKVQRDSRLLEGPEGYLGLQMPFLPAIKHNVHYRYVDVDSLDISLSDGETLPVNRAMERIRYDIKTSPEAVTMLEIVKTSVTHLATIVTALCLLFYVLIAYLFSRPLHQISDHIDLLRHSSHGSLGKDMQTLFKVKEMDKIRQSLNQYHSELAAVQVDIDRKNKELWRQAHHDALTGMLNRRAFEMELEKSREILGYHRVGLGLILFDLNHFKAINDSYGHQVGDDVLKVISLCIQNALRKNENLYRLGGDEFAAIIVGSDAEDSANVAQRCMDAVNEYDFSKLGIREPVRISCGIAHCQAHEIDKLDSLQWQADIAVYQAKRPGVNRPVLFTDEMADGSESVFSSWINDAVYEAVISGTGIEMHYQPVVSDAGGTIAYYESLVRLRHEGDMVPPANIFPIVVLRHMETEMDQAIIRKITEDLESKLINVGTGVAINLSAQSVSHDQLIEWLQPLTHYLDHYDIILEVTETSLITQLSTAASNLEKLRTYGYKVALDDFGSGYSSLRYLTDMPVDTIKFDISLIQGMEEERLHKMVRDLAAMLIELEFDLVAEGIESRELLNKAAAAGFQYFQGYYFGAPQRNDIVQTKVRSA